MLIKQKVFFGSSELVRQKSKSHFPEGQLRTSKKKKKKEIRFTSPVKSLMKVEFRLLKQYVLLKEVLPKERLHLLLRICKVPGSIMALYEIFLDQPHFLIF